MTLTEQQHAKISWLTDQLIHVKLKKYKSLVDIAWIENTEKRLTELKQGLNINGTK